MEKRELIKNLAKEELIEHLTEVKEQIETRLVGQQLTDLSIDYIQDHSQDFRRDDFRGVIDLSSFVHDEILSTDILFDSLVEALSKRISELKAE